MRSHQVGPPAGFSKFSASGLSGFFFWGPRGLSAPLAPAGLGRNVEYSASEPLARGFVDDSLGRPCRRGLGGSSPWRSRLMARLLSLCRPTRNSRSTPSVTDTADAETDFHHRLASSAVRQAAACDNCLGVCKMRSGFARWVKCLVTRLATLCTVPPLEVFGGSASQSSGLLVFTQGGARIAP